MSTVIRSRDDQINLWQTYGAFQRCFAMALGSATTAANSTSGYVTGQKYPGSITIPTLGSGVTGAYCSRLSMFNDDTQTVLMAAYATQLGSINMSSGTFTDGSVMPTRLVKGGSITSAAQMVVGVVETAITATTPVITITYKDQDGNTGNTATLTLPTNAILNSVFVVNPHLASGDTGVQDISNITKSAGSAGVLTFYGLHIIKTSNMLTNVGQDNPVEAIGNIPWIVSGGELIHFYRFCQTTTSNIIANVTLLPDN